MSILEICENDSADLFIDSLTIIGVKFVVKFYAVAKFTAGVF